MALPMPCNPCIPDTIMLIVISLPATDLQKGASATNHIESPYHRFKMFQTCTSQARITSDRNHQLLSRDSDIVKSPASILTYFNICHHKKTYLQTKNGTIQQNSNSQPGHTRLKSLYQEPFGFFVKDPGILRGLKIHDDQSA